MRPLPLISALSLAAAGLLYPAAWTQVRAQDAGAATFAFAAEEAEAEAGEALAAEVLAQDADAAVEADDPLRPRDAAGLDLEDFLWTARPIVVFADTDADPRFIEQMALLTQRPEALLERDVVIIFDTDPDARSSVRLALRPRGFSIVVLDKDGSIGLRRPGPRDVREIIRAIDNFQLRQEEIRSGR